MKAFLPRFLRIFTAIGLLLASSNADAQGIWAKITSDLERAHLDIGTGTLFSAQLLFFRTGLQNFRVEVIRAADFSRKGTTVAHMCKESHAVLCINASFFDETGNPLGLLVHRGIQIQDIHRGGRTLTGIFLAGRESIKIVQRSNYQSERVLEAVQAGPRILHAGMPVTGIELATRSRRSGVCIDKENRLIFFVVASGLLGLSMEELQAALQHPEIKCSEALNLDGGGSSQLYMSGKIQNASPLTQETSILGRDEVPIALALFPK